MKDSVWLVYIEVGNKSNQISKGTLGCMLVDILKGWTYTRVSRVWLEGQT